MEEKKGDNLCRPPDRLLSPRERYRHTRSHARMSERLLITKQRRRRPGRYKAAWQTKQFARALLYLVLTDVVIRTASGEMTKTRVGESGHVLMTDATAFIYEENPSKASTVLWLHLPLNITRLLEIPQRYVQLGTSLRRVCDDALDKLDQLVPEYFDATELLDPDVRDTYLHDRAKKRENRIREERTDNGTYFWAASGMFHPWVAEGLCKLANAKLAPIMLRDQPNEKRAFNDLVFKDVKLSYPDGIPKDMDNPFGTLKRLAVCQRDDIAESLSMRDNPQRYQDLMHTRTAIRVCYEGARSIETAGYQARARLDLLWDTHFINSASHYRVTEAPMLTHDGLNPIGLPRSGEKTRHKRGVASLLMQPLWYLTRYVTKSLAKKAARFALSDSVKPVLKPPRTLMGIHKPPWGKVLKVTGLGLGLGGYLSVRHKLRRESVQARSQELQLAQHARNLSVIQMQLSVTDERLRELELKTQQVSKELAIHRKRIDALEVTTLLNSMTTEALFDLTMMNQEVNAGIEELLDVVNSAEHKQLPSVFLPEVNDELLSQSLGMQHAIADPERPACLDLDVSSGTLNLYGKFLVNSEPWELYTIVPLPRFSDDAAFIRRPEFKYALLDKSMTRYIQLDPPEAELCRRASCPSTGVIRQVRDDPCTIRMITGYKAAEDCILDPHIRTPYLHSAEGALIYSVPSDITGRLECDERTNLTQPGIDRLVRLKGMGVYLIPEGCEVLLNEPSVRAEGPAFSIMQQIDTPSNSQFGNREHAGKPFERLTELEQHTAQIMNRIEDSRRLMGAVTVGLVTLGVLLGLVGIVVAVKAGVVIRLQQSFRRRYGDLSKRADKMRNDTLSACARTTALITTLLVMLQDRIRLPIRPFLDYVETYDKKIREKLKERREGLVRPRLKNEERDIEAVQQECEMPGLGKLRFGRERRMNASTPTGNPREALAARSSTV